MGGGCMYSSPWGKIFPLFKIKTKINYVIFNVKNDIRCIFQGVVNKKLNKVAPLRDKWIDKFPVAEQKAKVKVEKEKHLREILFAKSAITDIFSEDEKNFLLGKDSAKNSANTTKFNPNDITSEALRIYKCLRPDEFNFYEQDSMLSLESRLNAKLLSHSPLANSSKKINENEDRIDYMQPTSTKELLQCNLPAINANAFIIALHAVSSSIADDLENICEILEIKNLPSKESPFRLKNLIDAICEAFALRKDVNAVDDWMLKNYHKIKKLLPQAIQEIPEDLICEWLKGHIKRVVRNQKATSKIDLHKGKKAASEEWYNFGEDFMYDKFPLSEDLISERNECFPYEQSAEYMRRFLNFLQLDTTNNKENVESICAQFQQLIDDLQQIGLSKWMTMHISEFEQYLPECDVPRIDCTAEDIESARKMLKMAARKKINIFDLNIESCNPYKLFHEIPSIPFDEELNNLPENEFLSDKEIDEIFAVNFSAKVLEKDNSKFLSSRLKSILNEHGKTPLEMLLDKEKSEINELHGCVHFEDSNNSDPTNDSVSWRWSQPNNTIYDSNRQRYIREQEGIDPNLKLEEMRQTLLDVSRMMNMTKAGRVYYFRAIVCVGNGRGLYGIGIGFGENAKNAKKFACKDALKKLNMIDFDESKVMCTPVHGQEYSCHVKIVPRPLGRGIKCNRKFLPLAYILGLDNCKMTFHGYQHGWFTRSKALIRALQNIHSRRTLCNALGVKYSSYIAPGDHWVHWPDRWFRPLLKEYENKINKIKYLRHKKTNRKYFRSNISEIIPQEVRPEWTPYTWKSPLQKWGEEKERTRLIKHNIYHVDIFESDKKAKNKAVDNSNAISIQDKNKNKSKLLPSN